MNLLWQNENVFLKELIELLPVPKPAPSTVATLLKRMQEKGFIGYEVFGNSRRYFTQVAKSSYYSNHVKGIIKNSFENSSLQFASFFATAAQLSKKELIELRGIIDQEIKKKKK